MLLQYGNLTSFQAILATVKTQYEDNSYWNCNRQIVGEVSKLDAVQESCISWVYVETLRIYCSCNLQLDDFWGSKNASLGMKEDILLFKRWPGHLYWIINFIAEKKNKQFLFFISKMGSRTFAMLRFCYLTPYSYSLTSAVVFSPSQNFCRFWKQTWRVFINK